MGLHCQMSRRLHPTAVNRRKVLPSDLTNTVTNTIEQFMGMKYIYKKKLPECNFNFFFFFFISLRGCTHDYAGAHPALPETSCPRANVCTIGAWHGAPPPPRPNQNPGYAGVKHVVEGVAMDPVVSSTSYWLLLWRRNRSSCGTPHRAYLK